MQADDSIAFSFFPLNTQRFLFSAYRRKYREGETKEDFPDCYRTPLPIDPVDPNTKHDDVVYQSYWTTFEPKLGFDTYLCTSHTNHLLTNIYLSQLLRARCEEALGKGSYLFGRKFRNQWVSLVTESFDEGDRCVSLEPYLLKSKSKYGFLVDFRFRGKRNAALSRKILQLSLSLDEYGRSNKNFYADRYEQIQKFIALYEDKVFQLTDDIAITPSFINLDSQFLETKQYVFANNRTGSSQFRGIRQHGPLSPITDNTKVYFLYRPPDKPFADDLFRALRGDTFSYNFPGMENMFRFTFDGTNVGGTELRGFEVADIEAALSHIQLNADGRPIVPVVIIPFDRFDNDETHRRLYHVAKHTFLKHEIPTQFVSLKLLQQKNQFKWAISSIGLQLFAKMGGQPRQVKPKTENCLIIGIGQSHSVLDGPERRINKYFAYSILTESTGIYKELKVLGQTMEFVSSGIVSVKNCVSC